MISVDSQPVHRQLRACMAEFPTGVTVVTTVGGDGVPRGSTANAVTSLSLHPPLLTVYFGQTSATLAAVRQSGTFAVNILAAAQSEVASAFAVTDDPTAWDNCAASEGPLGVPLIDGCVAWLACRVEDYLPGGDHQIVVGEVIATGRLSDACEPLIFHRGGFR
ncbi:MULTISPECIES: flavin reductase family protein [unclassified Mycolicibacterium]|uniref:flavin reductase family protein n=1 Tax=unclassified Mycolicibacterium TaxID=2636767 RepID=UPI002ED8AF57